MNTAIKPMTKGEVRAQVIKHDKRIKRLILKKLRSVKFPVKIKPKTLKLRNKLVDLKCQHFDMPIFSMQFVVKCENTRFIVDAVIEGYFGIDLTKAMSGDNLMDCKMLGEWSFNGHLSEDDYRVDWKV